MLTLIISIINDSPIALDQVDRKLVAPAECELYLKLWPT